MTNEAQANDAFGIPDEVAAPGEGKTKGDVERDAFGFPKKYFKIEVYADRSKGAEQVVKVGVNGRAFLIKRGELVIVPSVVVDNLNNAIQEVTTQFEGGLETRPAHRFPFQMHGEATEAEYIAYQQKMRKGQAARAQAAAA